MKIAFYGAANTVTGSCFYVETNTKKFLVDCGLYQGQSKEVALNVDEFPFKPQDLDFMLLTHSHIDHSGRIPKLYIEGFSGSIYATKATVDLCSVMLPDSGHIQETEIEWMNRKRLRAGKHPIEPIYTMQDAIDSLKLFVPVRYDEEVQLAENIKIKFRDAGHMLGSSVLELWITEDGKEEKLVFSGDLGNKNIPILREPTIIKDADYLVMESTYGDRLHKENVDKVNLFIDIINETLEKGGNVVIPSFAVGRTQEIIYELHKQREKYGEKLAKLMRTPVFIDSPLAISATEIFRNNLDCYDEEAKQYIQNGDNPLDFPGLKFTRTVEESRLLNDVKEPCIIISASGMCEAGRIKHHLKHNLWRKECTILFVGYQAVGTLGRKIVEGAKKVKIFGEEVTVEARIEYIDGFSGHADKNGLLDWVDEYDEKPKNIILVHGEPEPQKELAKAIRERFGLTPMIPLRGDEYLLENDQCIKIGQENPEVTYKYSRLEVLEQLETLKEEVDELVAILKSDLTQETDDSRAELLKTRLKEVEKSIINVLKD